MKMIKRPFGSKLILSSFPRQPGSGKTILLKYLAYRHSRAMLGEAYQTDDIGKAKWPIYVRPSEFAKARRENSLLSMTQYIPMYFESHECNIEGFEEWVLNRLHQGVAVIPITSLCAMRTD